jgi:hypothetical protein
MKLPNSLGETREFSHLVCRLPDGSDVDSRDCGAPRDCGSVCGRGWHCSVERTSWLKRYLNQSFPEYLKKDEALDRETKIAVGKSIFRYHCVSCHATVGYNGNKPIIELWSRSMINDTPHILHRGNPGMPPCFGSDREREMLGEYLIHLKKQVDNRGVSR